MATEWWKIDDLDVIELIEEVKAAHHSGLVEANIGVLWRSESAVRQGRVVIGQASTVSAKWRAVMGTEAEDEGLHFIIWLSYEWWKDSATPDARRALVDHELCHCWMDDDKTPRMRGHDIEEFNEIIERHGLWRYDLQQTAKAIQLHLPGQALDLPQGRGKVTAVTLKSGNREVTLTSKTAKAAAAILNKAKENDR